MRADLMTQSQQSNAPAGVRLDPGVALRLPAVQGPSWLNVVDGRVWLTRSAEAGEIGADDQWLEAGDRVVLMPGDNVVVEGWPCARFEVLEAATGAPVSPSSQRPVLGAAWRAWAKALRTTPTRATPPAGACAA